MIILPKYFSEKDINLLQIGYEKSIEKLNEGTRNQYRDIIAGFLRNIVLDKIELNNYQAFFSEENISAFREMRKSLIVRSALSRLLKYMISEGYIQKGFDFEFSVETKEKRNDDFLTLEEIRYIFTEAIFKDKEEELTTKAMCALTCFCFYEQEQIKKLKRSDVLIEYGLIRNLRATEDDSTNTSHLIKWIRLNDIARECLVNYLNEYRMKLDDDRPEFFISRGGPITNDTNGVNRYLEFRKRKANREKISKINTQLLLSSTLLYWLTSTQGNALFKIMQIIESKNEQLQKAFRHFMKNYAPLENYEGVINIEDFEVIERGHLKEESQFDVIPNEEESGDQDNVIFYSEESDITVEELLDFDSINKNNLDYKQVSIDRLIRDTRISRELKNYYNNRCQLCGNQLRSANGQFMSEAHHIQPYNRTHKGDDTFRNLVILCPNCHAQFDQLYYAINPDTVLVHCLFDDDRYHFSKLEFIDSHALDRKYLEYAWRLFVQKKEELF